ncbi:hypothetical protein [Mycobacterium montefiorense]|uniref:Secreted protein n=1 Tax=Mycobacterium montefiorense TaxID=154654 RepID=A0AA37PKM6_9MYCO|nr:hypothetical protein [Mycobacterium montefiorense]GBG39095.1 hypothetical protein MmonteBS_34670 [Mycobacterium montefiorense]GKU37431.1 hypothetical protein NJB14191_47770 [Mycobacterium montefiorense]GKU42079.1 hypothetical protein NJB14192_40620 [Mycobacterium montefiorense]GKU45458.1 hypothetical protein NJB14194_20790 [Mycobacterium montefiorense]GKU53581.1 hypothetical protein NJB14195_48220 [Mycobacterium montefiorense]
MDASRVAVLPVAAAALFWVTEPATADPPPTQQITTVAVGSKGQAVNGYQETRPEGNVPFVSGCTPSPSAVADDVYSCSPSAAGAATCWPSTPGSLLCVDNPWDQRLHRVAYRGQLPPVQPTSSPEPFALALDDGTHCLLRNGGAWGSRDDGYVGGYWCGKSSANPSVLCLPSDQSCIDRSGPVWSVKVGQLGAPDAHFPPPQVHAVASAWFAGDRIPG